MVTIFEGKLRRLGNSMAIIIPSQIIREIGAKEGEVLKLSLPIPKSKRRRALSKIAGIDSKSGPFLREKRDRF